MDGFVKFTTVILTLGVSLILGVVSQSVGSTLGFIATLVFAFGIIAIIATADNRAPNRQEGSSNTNPVKRLQKMYVDGEISESEFESKLNNLSKSQEISEKVDQEPSQVLTELEK